MTELSPREARRLLRREILRRCWLPLLMVGIFIAVGLTLFAKGFTALTITVEGFTNVEPSDGTLRLVLIFSALSLSLALMRGEHSGLRPLLRRLPVAPTAAFRVRLELALACGLVVLAMAFLVEYFVAPNMLRPSFPSRLNPIESRTLNNLPGIPLLRFDIDGQVRRGLSSDVSLAAMQARGLRGYGGVFFLAQDHRKTLPKPGDLITRFEAAAWSTLSESEKQQLLRLGAPEGAKVTVTLERFISEQEYTSHPWRRDGLLRDRRWHASDRVIGFLGLLVVALSLSSLAMNLTEMFAMLCFAGFIPVYAFPGLLNGKPFVLMTDLDRSQLLGEQPTLPALPVFHHSLEHWLWPGMVCLISLAVYVLSRRAVEQTMEGKQVFARGGFLAKALGRLSPAVRCGVYGGLLSPFIVFLMADLNASVFAQSMVAGFLAFGVSFALIHLLNHWAVTFFRFVSAMIMMVSVLVLFRVSWLVPEPRASAFSWESALIMVLFAGTLLPIFWARREALLSRLPVCPMTIANRRLGWMLLGFVSLSLLPMVHELLLGRPQNVERSSFGGKRFCADDELLLESFGAVPLLQLRSEQDLDAFARDFMWKHPSKQPFLPRGSYFRFYFQILADRGRVRLQIGETLPQRHHPLKVVDLLTSREEVEAFLANAAPDQLGPVPGNPWLARSLIILVSGLLVLCLALLVRWPMLAGIVAMLIGGGSYVGLRPLTWSFYGGQMNPGPIWSMVMMLALVVLAALAHTVIRRRLTVGGPLDLRRWLSRHWRQLWSATDARRRDAAQNV